MNKIWHLLTAHHQISLRCDAAGKLQLAYLGARLAQPDDALADEPCPWPLYATERDATAPWGNYSGEYALQLELPDGSRAVELRLAGCEEEAQALRLHLRDARFSGLELELCLRVFPEEDVLTQRVILRNGTGAELLLLRGLSLALPLRAGAYYLTSFRGAWAGENELREQRVERGSTMELGSTTGLKCAEEGSPVFVLALDAPAAEESGRCVLGALAWSGNYTLSVKHSCYGHAFVAMGHDFEHSPYRVAPGQCLELPEALLVLSECGKGEASRRLHRHLRRRVLPRGGELRRSVLNSWEGVHFDVAEPTLHAMMHAAARLGVELFVVDDGWFGARDDDSSSLGDWEPDARKLPQGLAGLARQARAEGLDLGLWMEPEMISPRSRLYAEHPEAAMALPGLPPREKRRQLVLDPGVDYSRFVAQTLAAEPGISYIKWDCNRNISEPGAASLPGKLAGNVYFDAIVQYYHRLATLRAAFPQVSFQACSSGGGRVDLGAARYHEEFWLSDNTDPYQRLRIQWSALHFLPPQALACHVTVSPNLYTGRRTSLKFRCDVALMGRVGLELDPRILSPEESAELRERLALAHELRPLVQRGELHRLVSPYEGSDCALLYTDGERALLLAYTTERLFTDQHTRICLHGLCASRRYALRELLPDETGYRCPLQGRVLGGDLLMTQGLPLHWSRPMQSCVLLLEPEGV